MEETSNNAIAHDDMIAESINHHESQGSWNDLVSSHSKVNDSNMHLIDTVSEQDYDVTTPTDIFNNMQIFDGPGVSSRGTMQKMSKKLKDSIKSGFSHDWIAFQSSFKTDYDLNVELEEKVFNLVAFSAEMMEGIIYFHKAV